MSIIGPITPILTYGTPEEALAPLSAGTEQLICVLDCSGNTVTIHPPHPTWTDSNGKAIVLLDAVELGGQNGVYS